MKLVGLATLLLGLTIPKEGRYSRVLTRAIFRAKYDCEIGKKTSSREDEAPRLVGLVGPLTVFKRAKHKFE
jgi:hypothetical protein